MNEETKVTEAEEVVEEQPEEEKSKGDSSMSRYSWSRTDKRRDTDAVHEDLRAIVDFIHTHKYWVVKEVKTTHSNNSNTLVCLWIERRVLDR